MAPHERLRAWKASHEVVIAIYRASASWPKHETYGLTAQARRAAFSIAANIAEGAAKRGAREFRRFLDIALGSHAELCYVLQLARDIGLLSAEEWERLEELRSASGKLTWRLYQAIQRAG